VDIGRWLIRLAKRWDSRSRCIERGIAEGSIRAIDARKAATVLWASWNGIISLAWRPDELREDERGLANLLALAADMVSWDLRSES
jgi:TetR/AcrR family transcriptional regulator